MSTGTGGDQNSQGSGFDFRTLVSLAALVAAGAAIYYAVTVDASDKIADLEGSLKSLNTKVNELPTSDGVKQLIGETVVFPPQGPTADSIQAMIDESKMTTEQVQGLIDQSARPEAEIKALIEANTLNAEAVQVIIDNSVLSAEDVQNVVTTSLAEVNTAVSTLNTAISKLPNEARVNTLAVEATANTVPKGAVVAFATSCPTEFGWKEYEAARGRFVVAVGQNTDTAGTSRTFSLGIGDNDGAYQHVLTVDEMPAHRHAVDRQGPTRGIEGLPPIGTDGAIIATIEQEMTSTAGKGQAHNNVPPYIALHFCEKT